MPVIQTSRPQPAPRTAAAQRQSASTTKVPAAAIEAELLSRMDAVSIWPTHRLRASLLGLQTAPLRR